MTSALVNIDLTVLPSRWHQMRAHAMQKAYYESLARFNVVPAGRRSGKTEIAKRRLVKRAIKGSAFDSPRYFYAAPTRPQAKHIAWKDLKRLVPKEAMRGKPSESELTIPLWHGGELFVVGMDAPERIEGAPVDGGVMDEYGNMKEKAWGENVRPALSDRNGTCDLIGVPEGRNHYYDRARQAQAAVASGEAEWGYFHWKSADILPPSEIEAARRDLDERTFQQEYEASFVNFGGRAYYAFTDANKYPRLRSLYDPAKPLIFALDFNVSPGVAVIAQELFVAALNRTVTAVIGEVYIPDNSNTPAVCRKLLADWGTHAGLVRVYGDSTGGARGTAKVDGSDWEIARKDLKVGSGGQPGFGHRIEFRVKESNPAEKARLNAVNTRCSSADQTIRLLVDAATVPNVIHDFEGVTTLAGGSGEIDKKKNKKLTHITDALGYYVEREFPVQVATGNVSTFTVG